MAMACDKEVWACAVLCGGSGWWWWWWLRSGTRLRFKLRRVERWWLPRCASPGLVLPCSARICVVRQGWLLHTMQAGRGTVAYGTRLGMYTDSTGLAGWQTTDGPVRQSTVLLSAGQVRDTAATARTSGRLKVQERGEQEHRWSLAPLCTREKRGRTQGRVPNRLAPSSPAGGASALAFLAPLHLCPADAKFVLGALNACRPRSSRRAGYIRSNIKSGTPHHDYLVQPGWSGRGRRAKRQAGQGRAWQDAQHQQDMQPPTLPPLCVHTAARPCASLSPAMGAVTLTGKLSARQPTLLKMSIVN